MLLKGLFLYSIICLFITTQTFGFSQYENDIKKYYQLDDVDSKAIIVNKLWDKLHVADVESLKEIAIDLIIQANENSNENAIAIGKRALGSSLIRLDQQMRGIEYLKQALLYFQQIENFAIQSEILSEIGIGFLNHGNPINAENYFLQSLEIGKKSKVATLDYMAELNLSKVYIELNNYKKASALLQHYKTKSLENGKFEAVANAYALLGEIEANKGNSDLAVEYYQKSADFGMKSKSLNQIAHALNNLAIVYFSKDKMDSTLILFKKGLELRLKTGSGRFIAESYFNIGGYYFEVKNYEEAEKYYKICLDFARKNKLKRDEMDALMAMIELYKTTGKTDKTIALYEKYIEMQEAYFSEKVAKSTLSNEVLASIDQIDEENEAKRREMKMIQISKENNYKWIVWGLVVTLILLIIVVFLFKKRKTIS